MAGQNRQQAEELGFSISVFVQQKPINNIIIIPFAFLCGSNFIFSNIFPCKKNIAAFSYYYYFQTTVLCQPQHVVLQHVHTNLLVGHDTLLVTGPFQLMLLHFSWSETGDTRLLTASHLDLSLKKCLTFGRPQHQTQ